MYVNLSFKSSWAEFDHTSVRVHGVCTGVGSMDAPGAGAPMKFEWNTHKVTLFSELFFVIDLVYTWESEHPFIKSSSYAYGVHSHTRTILDCLLIIFVPMSAELLLLHCRAAMKPEAIKLSIAITLLHPPNANTYGACFWRVCVLCV